jgi:hypothetical protein
MLGLIRVGRIVGPFATVWSGQHWKVGKNDHFWKMFRGSQNQRVSLAILPKSSQIVGRLQLLWK